MKISIALLFLVAAANAQQYLQATAWTSKDCTGIPSVVTYYPVANCFQGSNYVLNNTGAFAQLYNYENCTELRSERNLYLNQCLLTQPPGVGSLLYRVNNSLNVIQPGGDVFVFTRYPNTSATCGATPVLVQQVDNSYCLPYVTGLYGFRKSVCDPSNLNVTQYNCPTSECKISDCYPVPFNTSNACRWTDQHDAYVVTQCLPGVPRPNVTTTGASTSAATSILSVPLRIMLAVIAFSGYLLL
eukprot:TRINITY_DN872_c0_g1_i1.p1 TRINITY_DN872_c0_g1~~TRINITY_DN872_c0_g1_i1.p1  ORF type:complete len:243 (+),score=54.75 TRINITY_DN872_c0_g1_i1:68-796(+)